MLPPAVDLLWCSIPRLGHEVAPRRNRPRHLHTRLLGGFFVGGSAGDLGADLVAGLLLAVVPGFDVSAFPWLVGGVPLASFLGQSFFPPVHAIA